MLVDRRKLQHVFSHTYFQNCRLSLSDHLYIHNFICTKKSSQKRPKLAESVLN